MPYLDESLPSDKTAQGGGFPHHELGNSQIAATTNFHIRPGKKKRKDTSRPIHLPSSTPRLLSQSRESTNLKKKKKKLRNRIFGMLSFSRGDAPNKDTRTLKKKKGGELDEGKEKNTK